jgi:hypothetical protein
MEAKYDDKHDGMHRFQHDEPSVTIDKDTGAVTIDVVAHGLVRIVLTADGDIEYEGRSILDSIQWTYFQERNRDTGMN